MASSSTSASGSSLEEQLRSKTSAVQHLVHKVALAEAKEETLLTQLAEAKGDAAAAKQQVEILHEAMAAMAEQLKRKTLEAEAEAAEASREIEAAHNANDNLNEDVADLQAQMRTKDETIAVLLDRLNRYEKTYGLSASGPIAQPIPTTVSPAQPDRDRSMFLRRNSGTASTGGGSGGPTLKRILRPFTGGGPSSSASNSSIASTAAAPTATAPPVAAAAVLPSTAASAATPGPAGLSAASVPSTGTATPAPPADASGGGFSSHFPSLNLHFGGSGDKSVRQLQLRVAKLEEDLVAANEALEAHRAQNAILNEELLHMKLVLDPADATRFRASGDTSDEDSATSDRRRHGESEAPQLMASSLKQAMDDDDMDVSVKQLKASEEAARKELTHRLPIPPNSPLVPGFDRYGFMENDVLASGSEALLRRIEKKQKEEEYLKYETTQRMAFDAFLAKKGQHLDALPRSDELKILVRGGVPRDYRSQVWMQVSGASKLKEPGVYNSYLNDNVNRFSLSTQQIELDVHRTLPTNRYFQSQDAPGIPKLRRLLTAYSWRNPLVGYCQGMNLLAGALLLVMEEEDAFWCLVTIIERILPQNYYTSNLLISQADQRVLKELVAEKRPRLVRHMEQEGVDLTLITFNWFLSIFVDCVPPEVGTVFDRTNPSQTFFRIWDCFLYEGSKVLFRFAMGILRMNEEQILQRTGTGPLFQFLRNMTSRLYNVNELAKFAFSELKPFPRSRIMNKRQKYSEIVRQELQAVEVQRVQMEEQVRAESQQPRPRPSKGRASDESGLGTSDSDSVSQSSLFVSAPMDSSLALPVAPRLSIPDAPEPDGGHNHHHHHHDDEDEDEDEDAATTAAADSATEPASPSVVRDTTAAAVAIPQEAHPVAADDAYGAGSLASPLAWPSAVMGLGRYSPLDTAKVSPVRTTSTRSTWATGAATAGVARSSASAGAGAGSDDDLGGWDAAPQALAERR